MVAVHTNLRMQGSRIRELRKAVNPDEPVRAGDLEPPKFDRGLLSVNEGQGTMPVGKTSLLVRLQANSPCRIRLYSTAAAREADAPRGATKDPEPGSGLLFEFLSTTQLLSAIMSPVPTLPNGDVPPKSVIYYLIEATNGGTTVAFNFITLEN